MRLLAPSLLAIILALGFGCSSASEEPAPAATEGAEAAPPPPPEPAPAPPPAAEPPPAPAPVAAPATAVAPQPPPFAAMIVHDVKDYDAWKTVFDGHVDARKGAGILGEDLMRGLKNDKTVALFLPASDLEKLKAFTTDKALKDKMKEAGVKGKPAISLLTNIGGKFAPPGTEIVAALLKYEVKDFAAFKAGLEGQADARAAAGIIGYGVAQGAEKATEAFVYLQANDAAKLEAYVASKETKAAMKAAGGKGQPKPSLLKEISSTTF